MGFVDWLAGIIAKAVVSQVMTFLKEEREAQTKINAITTEAKSLMGELDVANSDEERKAIMRKIGNFSDLKHLL
jgi:hypothetical protein